MGLLRGYWLKVLCWLRLQYRCGKCAIISPSISVIAGQLDVVLKCKIAAPSVGGYCVFRMYTSV